MISALFAIIFQSLIYTDRDGQYLESMFIPALVILRHLIEHSNKYRWTSAFGVDWLDGRFGYWALVCCHQLKLMDSLASSSSSMHPLFAKIGRLFELFDVGITTNSNDNQMLLRRMQQSIRVDPDRASFTFRWNVMERRAVAAATDSIYLRLFQETITDVDMLTKERLIPIDSLDSKMHLEHETIIDVKSKQLVSTFQSSADITKTDEMESFDLDNPSFEESKSESKSKSIIPTSISQRSSTRQLRPRSARSASLYESPTSANTDWSPPVKNPETNQYEMANNWEIRPSKGRGFGLFSKTPSNR